MIFDKDRKKAHSILRGLIGPKYELRLESGDWSPYFGTYEGQRYGYWDTQSCWDWAGVENCETQLEFLWKTGQFSLEDRKWFTDNGYIDEDGDFYLSRRWGAILGGVWDNGNDQIEFWRLAEKHGLIPNKMLPYVPTQYGTRQDFIDDFFNPTLITPAMLAMGQEFLKRVKIQSKELGKRWSKRTPQMIKVALQQAPLQFGVPVPNDGTWNREKVKWDGSYDLDHSIECYAYKDGDYPYKIYDSYIPFLKELSADYYVPIITQGILTARKPAIVVLDPTPSSPLSVLISYALAVFYGLFAKDPQISSG